MRGPKIQPTSTRRHKTHINVVIAIAISLLHKQKKNKAQLLHATVHWQKHKILYDGVFVFCSALFYMLS